MNNYHNAVFWNPAPDSPGLLIECFQISFPEQIAWCSLLLAVTLDEQAVDYTNGIFSSSKTPDFLPHTNIHKLTQSNVHMLTG